MTDAEWLRERPEIVEAYVDAFMCAYHGDNTKATEAGIVAVITLLRAAIRADVVRELAGDADEYAAERIAAAAEQYFDTVDEEFAKNFTADINIALAAAHAQGRAAGREEAAKLADAEMLKRTQWANSGNPDYGDPMIQTHKAVTASTIARAIRSLP